ncbi:MAG TPA: carboxypeptidase-like regulatory domain-containing protein [Bryobacteraceae bacterium]|nr:carboxypeptidase-like regulatory domain-containing protein [Bryobacteraceae bacterium]
MTTGGIAGTVTDPTGAFIPNATATLKSLSNGSTQTTTTNAQGAFSFSLLQPGDYTVEAKVNSSL